MVDPTASKVLYDSKASIQKKELKILAEMKHELLEDPDNGNVIDSITEWLRRMY